jgi:polyhydroxyalkanoic acid synthase PhaR subunit
MSQQMSFDPFALWKQMYDKVEEQWSQTMDENMHKEDFSKWMGQCLNGYLQYQDMARKSTEKYLEQANMPSRQDLANVASMVINVEEKVDSLERIIEENVLDSLKKGDTAKEIQLLKTELAKLSTKMDQIADLLATKLQTSAEVASTAPNVKAPAENQKNK